MPTNHKHLPPTGQPNQTELRALLGELGPDVIVSHLTAWHLHGLPAPRELDDGLIHLATPQTGKRIRRRGIRIRRRGIRIHRRTNAPQQTTINGIRTVTALQAWIDLAALKPDLVSYVACGDALIHNNPNAFGDLITLVQQTRNARGIPYARHAMVHLRRGAESFKETEVRLRINHPGLPEPRLNLEIRTPEGVFIARCDMVYPDQRVIVEYDGHYHNDETRRRRDLTRINQLQHHGWRILTLSQHDLTDPTNQWVHQLTALLNTPPKGLPYTAPDPFLVA